MKTHIAHMQRFGRMYSVMLACDHKFPATADEAGATNCASHDGPVRALRGGEIAGSASN